METYLSAPFVHSLKKMLRERYIFINYDKKTKRNEFSYLFYNIESLIQCELISFVESHLLSYLDTKV